MSNLPGSLLLTAGKIRGLIQKQQCMMYDIWFQLHLPSLELNLTGCQYNWLVSLRPDQTKILRGQKLSLIRTRAAGESTSDLCTFAWIIAHLWLTEAFPLRYKHQIEQKEQCVWIYWVSMSRKTLFCVELDLLFRTMKHFKIPWFVVNSPIFAEFYQMNIIYEFSHEL